MIWGFGSLMAAGAYLLIGWRLALRDLPGAWERARRDWTRDESIQGSVKIQTVCMILFWPLLVVIRTLSQRLDNVVTRGDPVELRRQLKQREQRIAALEQELGIGRDG